MRWNAKTPSRAAFQFRFKSGRKASRSDADSRMTHGGPARALPSASHRPVIDSRC
jgi:hypothetical protein